MPLPQSLGALAQLLRVELKQGNPDTPMSGVATLESATAQQMTFVADDKYALLLPQTKAGAVILSEKHLALCPTAALLTETPKLVFAQLLQWMTQKQTIPGVHPTAVIDQRAVIHETASVGPYCVIGNSTIGPNVVLGAHTIIGDQCVLSEKVYLHARVTLYNDVWLGEHTVVHSGTIIGSDGFGFVPKQTGGWEKMPQVGGVRIGERVDIGANTTIDRGALSHTIIEQDVILDNLIQIAHNVTIGAGTAMAACTVVAGSTTIGQRCLIGGASLISGHITIADDVHLAGGTGVSNHIKEKGTYASTITARPFEQWKRNLARFHHLDDLGKRIKQIEKWIKAQ